MQLTKKYRAYYVHNIIYISPGTAEVSGGESQWEVGGRGDRGRSQLQRGTETTHLSGQSFTQEQQDTGSR